ncbi:tol-pal system protein YbgF [Modicisalibacter ilicicola DSM 19980]|uniref:Cell division coordinator CpoB n=1 Tax=Modicisalibacter ilicicola DSM 19980 TaxID=1121942 RepID=A0A1M4XE56_9GAMM|nr:tol-pal system protein YbgF [Halomonas ilicicola]SHE91909.1 tol-pal system protein YbgF [Halomonas ilicicola DSM 19980]
MKHGLIRLCGAGALLLPLSVGAAPTVKDLSTGSNNFYQNTQARESSAGANLRILNQLQENERQLQELRGQIEELRYQLDQQKQLSQERYLDLEQRVSQSGQPASGGAQAAQDDVDAEAANSVATSGRQDGQQAYQAAFQKVQSRDFDAAIEAFEAFVGDYPDSPLRANAHYWLGELYSSRSELEPAAQAFNNVIENHPESNKVPDALYKLGLLKARQGQPDASKQLLTRVRQEYPQSNAADMAADFLNQSGL